MVPIFGANMYNNKAMAVQAAENPTNLQGKPMVFAHNQ